MHGFKCYPSLTPRVVIRVSPASRVCILFIETIATMTKSITRVSSTFALLAFSLATAKHGAAETYQERVDQVRSVPSLAAFWNFMEREDGIDGKGNFVAITDVPGEKKYPLTPRNISLDFWNDGEPATLESFPLMNRGPFGQAVQFREPKSQNDLPVLAVPRTELHDSRIDVKGAGKSVSMVIWLIYQSNNHAIAGIWHEGTDTQPTGLAAVSKVRGQRQYGMFAGLAANPGAASIHVSENGIASFGDRYARHLAVAPEKMRRAAIDATPEQLDASWTTIGFVYDNAKKTVVAYNEGKAIEQWVEAPETTRFFSPAANAWKQAWLASKPGTQPGEVEDFPADQFYAPPESKPLSEIIESDTDTERVVLRTYEFTKVRSRLKKEGGMVVETDRQLVALKVNPWYFGYDIYSPPSAEEGGPFTIGRVIHSNRHNTFNGWIGGVAVYDRALEPVEVEKLSKVGKRVIPRGE